MRSVRAESQGERVGQPDLKPVSGVENIVSRMLAGTAQPAFAIDERQIVRFWNGGMEALTGISQGWAVGRACFDLLAGKGPRGEFYCQPGCLKACAAREGRVVEGYEMEIRTMDGERRWLALSFLPVAVGGGHLLVHVCHDITALWSVRNLVLQAAGTLRLPRTGRNGAPLTTREKEVVELLLEGRSTRDISRQLRIAYNTARSYIQNILKKTAAKNRLDLFRMFTPPPRHGTWPGA